MPDSEKIQDIVGGLLKESRLAVLATVDKGQPYTSLVAITPFQGCRKIIFATYKNTRKFNNLKFNSKVAVLIQCEGTDSSGRKKIFALTAFGQAAEPGIQERKKAVYCHLERHPDLDSLLKSSDLALFIIEVELYQLVRGIDDVTWLNVDDSGSNPELV